MNTTTRKIRNKGYKLSEFLAFHGISLRTYRRWEKSDSKFNDVLNVAVNTLPPLHKNHKCSIVEIEGES